MVVSDTIVRMDTARSWSRVKCDLSRYLNGISYKNECPRKSKAVPRKLAEKVEHDRGYND